MIERTLKAGTAFFEITETRLHVETAVIKMKYFDDSPAKIIGYIYGIKPRKSVQEIAQAACDGINILV